METGLVEVDTNKRYGSTIYMFFYVLKLKVRFYVTSVSSGKRTLHKTDFVKARNIFQDGTLLESMEKHEKNIFYHIRQEDDIQYECLKEKFHCSSSMFEVIIIQQNDKTYIMFIPDRN